MWWWGFDFTFYLVAGSAISRTHQRHTPFPHTSALKSLQRWVKPLTGMSWKRGIRKFLQVGKTWTGCRSKPNLTVGSNLQMLTELCFRVLLSWYSNGILHGNYWNDRKWWTCCPGNGGSIPGRPSNQRWNWIYGWWTRPWGENAQLMFASVGMSVNLKSVINCHSLHFCVSLIVWSNDSGNKIPQVKNRFACKWCSSQSSSFEGYSWCWSPPAGSGSPGRQQKQEKATEKSRLVWIFISIVYMG